MKLFSSCVYRVMIIFGKLEFITILPLIAKEVQADFPQLVCSCQVRLKQADVLDW
ncbi:MAG: hypothetical protein Ct9H300mP28_26860 [Pseudomonadota bacterium]|nr:MAG: hypothetical protein Ct9H300mP28_26860 [Pseudomonadota bacterium]